MYVCYQLVCQSNKVPKILRLCEHLSVKNKTTIIRSDIAYDYFEQQQKTHSVNRFCVNLRKQNSYHRTVFYVSWQYMFIGTRECGRASFMVGTTI